MTINPDDDGYAGIYHEHDPPPWEGPTGFYYSDHRGEMKPEDKKEFEAIFVWANTTYQQETMFFTIQNNPLLPAPDDRAYILELVTLPKGIGEGAPPEGTTWNVPLGNFLTIELPTFGTRNGLEGYEFSFTITEVIPEPSSVSLLAATMGPVLMRRRRRF